jgi:ribosome-associated protein
MGRTDDLAWSRAARGLTLQRLLKRGMQPSAMSAPLVVSPAITIPGADLRWTAVRSSGPGGQNVNKVSSKIELRFDLVGCTAIDGYTKARLRSLARSKLDSEGRLVVVSQASRDRQRNLEDAREKLRELIARACQRPKARRATRPSFSSVRARLEQKKRTGVNKRQRRSGFED